MSSAELLVTTWVQHPTSALLEWIAHHRAVGATRFHLFYPNNQTEIPELIAALVACGAVEATALAPDLAESGEQLRNVALRAAELEADGNSGFGLFLGCDEYLILHKHSSFANVLAELKYVHALTAPLVHFVSEASGKHIPGSVLEKAVKRTKQSASPKQWRSVVKQGLWRTRLPGYPTGKMIKPLKQVQWLNGSGKQMPRPWADHSWQHEQSATGSELVSVAWLPAPSIETMLLRAAYAHPVKSQPMPEDLAPVVNAIKGDLVADDSFLRQAASRSKELAKLMSDERVARAQEAQCEEEINRAQKQRNRHKLWTAILGYMEGKPIELQEADTKVKPDAGLTPAGQKSPPMQAKAPEASPVKVSKHQRRYAALDARPVKEHPKVPDAFARVATDPPPSWFAEIYPGGDRQGFLTRLEHHSIIHIERDPDTLIVSFDNISNVHDISYGREPWAYKFVRDAGYSHLAVIARRKDWYRDTQLIDRLKQLADQGLFSKYGKVVMTGTSMGGFAALAFSSLAPGCTVLAYSPQSTLDGELVPWEERFGMGRARNWSLEFSDAAFEIGEAGRVFVVYDPFFEPDKKHVERLEGENTTHLKAWFAGHFSAVFIRRANLIKPLFEQVIDGTLTEQSYYSMLRGRRSLMWYRKALEERAVERGHFQLAERIGPTFKRNRRKMMQEV